MPRSQPTACGTERRIPHLLCAGILFALCLGLGVTAAAKSPRSCSQAARDVRKSCQAEARAEYFLARARCDNLADASDRRACESDARQELRDALGECRDQYGARRDVCADLGEESYDPAIDPAQFTTTVNNPFFPLVPGTTWVYETNTADGLEHDETTVTDETREILGVTCVVVRDTVTLDGELVEDTWDWYAQDADGNVWYFGEHSESYENGDLADLGGSWEAGVDGARPGIIMPATPEVGSLYRQEYAVGDAEDLAQVLALDQSATVAAGEFTGCVQTKDFSPMEPDVIEHKFYAPDVGIVLEEDLETGDRTELIEVITGG